MNVAFLAYGFRISNYDPEDAATLLLTAAHAENKFTEASTGGWLDSEATRDPDYQLSLLDLTIQNVGDGQPLEFVIASYLESTDQEPLAVVGEPPVGVETQNLRWAARILKVPDDEEPAWMLGHSSLG